MSLKIGITSTTPDNMDLDFFDLHTNNLFVPIFDRICTGTKTMSQTVTVTPPAPHASVGGTQSNQHKNYGGGDAPYTYTTTYNVNTYEYVPVNPIKSANNASAVYTA